MKATSFLLIAISILVACTPMGVRETQQIEIPEKNQEVIVENTKPLIIGGRTLEKATIWGCEKYSGSEGEIFGFVSTDITFEALAKEAKKTIDLFYVNVLANDDSLHKARSVLNHIFPNRFFSYPTHSYLIYFAASYLQDGIAKAYVKKSDIENAISEYERLIAFDSNNWYFIQPKYYYELAKLYEQKGSVDKAIENYTIFLDYCKLSDQTKPEMIAAEKRLARIISE